MRELLSLEADVLAHDGDRHTALHVAAMGGHVGVLKLLAEAGGLELLLKASHAGRTACECAALEGHKDAEAELTRLQHDMITVEVQRREFEHECRERAEQAAAKNRSGDGVLTREEHTEIVYNMLLNTSPSSEEAAPEQGKFAKELICGEYRHAAQGFQMLLNVSEDDVFDRARAGVAAIEEEVKALGDKNVLKQLDYILHRRASVKSFSNGLRDKGHEGMRLQDFVRHEHAVTAKLTEAEVVALRLYTTSAFKQINDPLRDQERISRGEAHPLPVTVTLIAKGIKKLRIIDARKAAVVKVMVLWRGMKNVTTTAKFADLGGTEVMT